MTPPTSIKTLEDATKYHQCKSDLWTEVLDYLERTLTGVRDQKLVPIYLTKGRLKQPDSAYLKFKRKRCSDPKEISDWIGFRVLCLFEQDVHEAFAFLIDLLLNRLPKGEGTSVVKYFSLREVTIFNWPKDRSDQLIQRLNKRLADDPSKTEKVVEGGSDIAYTYNDPDGSSFVISFQVRRVDRESRYQSVHFVADANLGDSEAVSCEIQLRTLLQDVWGELEHALSYKKGKIHPHISKSFQLLSRELEAKDILVSQLRELRDQENALVRYSSTSAGPSRWMNYPEGFLGAVPAEAQPYWGKYTDICKSRKRGEDFGTKRQEARNLLDEVSKCISGISENLDYVISMESAYLAFCSEDLEDAEEQYSKVMQTTVGNTQWFPFFRCGEARLALEKTGEALVAFDQCEDRMKVGSDYTVDHYLAKVGLAYSYWSLGKEFLPICVEKIEEAAKLIEDYFQLETAAGRTIEDEGALRLSIANNLCFYYLESWLAIPSTAGVEEIHQKKHRVDTQYAALIKAKSDFSEQVSSNVCDTLAWYRYNVAEREDNEVKKKEHIRCARQFVREGEYLSNRAPSRTISGSIQREHMQLILTKYMEIK